MKDKEEIGKIILEGRRKKEITQQELAERLNVTDKAISNWETGRNYPDYSYLNDLSEILEINFYKTEEPKKNIKRIIIQTIISIVFILLSLYFIINFNQFKMYKIESDKENIYLYDSYLTITKDKILLTLGNVENDEDFSMIDYKLTLYIKDKKEKIILEKEYYEGLTIEDSYSKGTILNKDIIKKLDKIYIKIEYSNKNKEKKVLEIPLKFKKISNNNKLIYINKTEEIKLSKDNQILLKNHGYKKVGINLYERKTPDNALYIYNPKERTMKYLKKDLDTETYIKYISNEIDNVSYTQHHFYRITKNNEIINESNLKKIEKNSEIFWGNYSIVHFEYQRVRTT